MKVEQYVYANCRVGIESDRSGGQSYSYTSGMRELMTEEDINIGEMAGYEEPVDDELAPMSYTYEQLETLFPKQFRYKNYTLKSNKKIFAFSNNCLSPDWPTYKDYNEYLEISSKNRNRPIGGRGGSHEFYIIAGDYEELQGYPCEYFKSPDIVSPYTGKDFISSKRPEIMQPLSGLHIGGIINKASVRNFIKSNSKRAEYLKQIVCCLLHYRAEGNRSYDKNLVICDEKDEIIYWIAAIQFLFSEEIAKELTFSTYEYEPVGAPYRICGAFKRGSGYYYDSSNSAAYVFDFCNNVIEEADDEIGLELAEYLISGFMQSDDRIDQFYKFVSKFGVIDADLQLERIFELYHTLYSESKDMVSAEKISTILSIANMCTDIETVKNMITKFLAIYQKMSLDEFGRCESEAIEFLKNHIDLTKKIISAYAEQIMISLVKDSRILIEKVNELTEKYEYLSEKLDINWKQVYYNKLVTNQNKILNNNRNIAQNLYIADIVLEHVIDDRKDIECCNPQYEEGKIIYHIMENILLNKLSSQNIKECLSILTDRFIGDANNYLSIITELEGMARDFETDTSELWIELSDNDINSFLDSQGTEKMYSTYELLIELGYSNLVTESLVKRCQGTEEFETVYNDAKKILMLKERELRANEGTIIRELSQAVEIKSCNRVKCLLLIMELRNNTAQDMVFLDAAERLIKYASIDASGIQLSDLENIDTMFKQNSYNAGEKFYLLYELKYVQKDIESKKRYDKERYRYISDDHKGVFDLKSLNDADKYHYLEILSHAVSRLYINTADLFVLYYFNNIFKLNKFDREYMSKSEFEGLCSDGSRSDADLICGFIAYINILNCRIQDKVAAEILNNSRMNIKKINKFFDENNKDIISNILKTLGIKSKVSEYRDSILSYWNDIYNISIQTDKGIVNKGMTMVKKFFGGNKGE